MFFGREFEISIWGTDKVNLANVMNRLNEWNSIIREGNIDMFNVICDVLLVVFSGFAIIQYLLNRRQQYKSAATIVYNQLKNFDEYIGKIKNGIETDDKISDFQIMCLNCALESNYWEKSKYILVKFLNQEDIHLINKAYEIIENVEVARKRIIDTFMMTNNAKSYALQFKLIELIEAGNKDELNEVVEKFNGCKHSFIMRMPRDVLIRMVRDYEMLSGTTTMQKLRKLSYKNKK